MTIEDVLFQLLSNLPELASDIGDRVYFEFNPNSEEKNYIVYQKISHLRPLDIDSLHSVETASFQVDIYSDGETKAKTIRDSMIEAIHGLSNSDYGEDIQLIYVETDSSGYESDADLYRITTAMSIYF